VNYDTINDILIRRFPELSSLFQEQFEFWNGEEIPPHCFYGDVLNHYVTELLRENKNPQQIDKIFNFYEELASSDCWEIRNILQVTLLEYLWDEKPVYRNALKNMKPNTLILNNEIAAYFNKPAG